MIDLETILGAIRDIALIGLLTVLCLLVSSYRTRRAVSALVRRIRGEFASPSQAHPAARAASVRGWEHIPGAEDREFERIAERLREEMGTDATFPAQGEGR